MRLELPHELGSPTRRQWLRSGLQSGSALALGGLLPGFAGIARADDTWPNKAAVSYTHLTLPTKA